MRLGIRLGAVLDQVPPSRCVADVGTDHGKLALSLLETGRAQRVIATDVSVPSLDKARRLILATPHASRAEFRAGDGLQVVNAGEVDTVVISGMGGKEIVKIITSGPRFPAYVLSPQRDMRYVRESLISLGYRPECERVVKEDGKFYFVMTFAEGPCDLDELELEFGRQNLANPGTEFKEYLALKQREYGLLLGANPDNADITAKVQLFARAVARINEGK